MNWNLTTTERRAIEAYIKTGSRKKAASSLGWAEKTFSTYIYRSREKMGKRTVLLALLAYDRIGRDG